MKPKLKLGIYLHPKSGKRYRVIGVGKHSETLEDLVFYKALYKNKESKLWARPLESFTGRHDYSPGVNGPRFQFVRK